MFSQFLFCKIIEDILASRSERMFHSPSVPIAHPPQGSEFYEEKKLQ